jgi:hypothetical protein
MVSAPAAGEHPPAERRERRPPPLREHPPGLTTRLFAERDFWQLSPLAAGQTRQLDDLRGRLTVEAGAQGACGTYEAMVLSGLLAVWGDGARAEPTVECGLRRLSGVLGLAWGGRTATQLSTAIERLKTMSYRATVSDEDGGRERLFSLIDEIETTSVGPPTTIHRRIRAVFSRTACEAISEPRILRTVDLSVLRTLGPRREHAACSTCSRHNPATSWAAVSKSSSDSSTRDCSRASARNGRSGRSHKSFASPPRRSPRRRRATAESSSSRGANARRDWRGALAPARRGGA